VTTITKCYTRAAGAFAIEASAERASVSYFIVSSFRNWQKKLNNGAGFLHAIMRETKNRKSRFAMMLSRSKFGTRLFDIVEKKHAARL
jgi:hypothetical protein